MHFLAGLVVVLAVANAAFGIYISQVAISLLDTRSNCSGVVASPNMIITSAQCVHHAQPNRLQVLTTFDRFPLIVNRVHVHNLFNVNNLSSDVAVLQLNGTTIAPAADIDWSGNHVTRCKLDAKYGKYIPLPREPFVAPLDLTNCSVIYNHQLTSCLNYTLNDVSKCHHNYNELATERGTPIVCGGSCTGILSAITQSPGPQCNASAYFTRFNSVNGPFVQSIINANRPASAAPGPMNSGVPHGLVPLPVNSGGQHGGVPVNSIGQHGGVPVNAGVPHDGNHQQQNPQQHHHHPAVPTQHVPYANRTTKKNGKSGVTARTPNIGVICGFVTFAVFVSV